MNALEIKDVQANILSQLTVPQVNVLPAPPGNIWA
jgi:hypothetical protein